MGKSSGSQARVDFGQVVLHSAKNTQYGVKVLSRAGELTRPLEAPRWHICVLHRCPYYNQWQAFGLRLATALIMKIIRCCARPRPIRSASSVSGATRTIRRSRSLSARWRTCLVAIGRWGRVSAGAEQSGYCQRRQLVRRVCCMGSEQARLADVGVCGPWQHRHQRQPTWCVRLSASRVLITHVRIKYVRIKYVLLEAVLIEPTFHHLDLPDISPCTNILFWLRHSPAP